MKLWFHEFILQLFSINKLFMNLPCFSKMMSNQQCRNKNVSKLTNYFVQPTSVLQNIYFAYLDPQHINVTPQVNFSHGDLKSASDAL